MDNGDEWDKLSREEREAFRAAKAMRDRPRDDPDRRAAFDRYHAANKAAWAYLDALFTQPVSDA